MANRRDVLTALAFAPVTVLSGAAPADATERRPPLDFDPRHDWSVAPDEAGDPDGYATFSKGLAHGSAGVPDPQLYRLFREAIRTRDVNALERLGSAAGMRWVDPTAGARLNPAETVAAHRRPWFRSRMMLAETAELYWAALCRDVPFAGYRDSTLVAQAERELENVGEPVSAHRPFRCGLPGTDVGPYVSQFLLQPIPFGPVTVEQKLACPEETNDFMASLQSWHSRQNGEVSQARLTYLERPRCIFSGRMLAEYVRTDFTYQPYLSAALLIRSFGRYALNPGLSDRYTRNVSSFVDSGWPDVFALLAEASILALRDCWFWKWRVFRRLRPEELSARIAMAMDGPRDPVLRELGASLIGLEQCRAKFGTPLLPQAYPDGCPLHPSFPSGHAAIAGACVTVLKAFSNPEFVLPEAAAPALDGRTLERLGATLPIEGELNKLAWNISFGRTFAGIHYRSDCDAGLMLGERIGMRVLSARGRNVSGRRSVVWFPQFDGNWVSVEI